MPRTPLSPSFFLVALLIVACTNGLVPSLRNLNQPKNARSASFQNDNSQPAIVEAKPNNEESEDSTESDTSRRTLFHRIATTLGAAVTAATTTIPGFSSPALAVTTTTTPYLIPSPTVSKETYWPLGKIAFSLLPLAGGNRRATILTEIVPNKIWTCDQIQGIVNVNVPVRQTIVKLSPQAGGGLWVHNPVAPTPQLLQYMHQLESQHGPIRHIVLGTVALEHKATLGPFARKFPHATVWIQPGQWSFPISYNIEDFGVSQRRSRGTLRDLLPQSSAVAPEWKADFDYEILGPLKFQSVGAFSETAFYHKSTKSLVVTDVVVSVTEEPPAIIQEDPRALLFHSRDSATDTTLLTQGDTPALRRKGWRRMVQFGLIFLPSQINVPDIQQDFQDATQIPKELRNLGDDAVPLNLYPWTWNGDADLQNFQIISNKGALFCPPILTKLILDREPQRVLAWVDTVTTRFKNLKRVIPCHLNNDISSNAKDFYKAFDSLRCTGKSARGPLDADLKLLQEASDVLTKFGVVSPTQVECRRANF